MEKKNPPKGMDVSYKIKTGDRFYAAAARTAFKGDGQQSLHHFWYVVLHCLLQIKRDEEEEC